MIQVSMAVFVYWFHGTRRCVYIYSKIIKSQCSTRLRDLEKQMKKIIPSTHQIKTYFSTIVTCIHVTIHPLIKWLIFNNM